MPCKKVEPVVAAFADLRCISADFGAATKVKLVNNLLVALHIAGTAQAMALGLKTGVDKDLLIKAVATGSGGSTAFAIRAPWMAERKFPAAAGLGRRSRSLSRHGQGLATDAGVATDLLDCLIGVFDRARADISADRDVAAMLEYFVNHP